MPWIFNELKRFAAFIDQSCVRTFILLWLVLGKSALKVYNHIDTNNARYYFLN